MKKFFKQLKYKILLVLSFRPTEGSGGIAQKEEGKGSLDSARDDRNARDLSVSLRSGRDDKDSAIPGSFFPVIPSPFGKLRAGSVEESLKE